MKKYKSELFGLRVGLQKLSSRINVSILFVRYACDTLSKNTCWTPHSSHINPALNVFDATDHPSWIHSELVFAKGDLAFNFFKPDASLSLKSL